MIESDRRHRSYPTALEGAFWWRLLHGEPRIEKNRSMRTSAIPFTRGPLAHLLRNRFYFREGTFKGEILKGRTTGHSGPGLVRRSANPAQEQATNHKATRMKPEALLAGRIFNDRGNRMSPTCAQKRGIK